MYDQWLERHQVKRGVRGSSTVGVAGQMSTRKE